MADTPTPPELREPTLDELLGFMHADERQFWHSGSGTPKHREEFLEGIKARWRAAQQPSISLTTSESSEGKSDEKAHYEDGVNPIIPHTVNSPRRLRTFLCHSSGDKPTVRELYHRLRSAAPYIAPWLDEEDLLPGQRWEDEIPKAVRESDVVIVCLSRHSITKKGYVQKEIKFALDVADEQPEGTIYLIPVGLEDCELPQRLKHLHCVNLQESRGFEQLMRSLRVRAESLGITENASSIKPASIDKETEHSLITSLRQELLASYPGDREKAARQLGRFGPTASSAVPTLIKKLKDSSGPVRDAAAWALREIGTKPALDALASYENE